MDDFETSKKQVHTDEDGLMNDVGELRDMVHSLSTTVYQVINVPTIRDAMRKDLYEGLSSMLESAHALVCPKARTSTALTLLNALAEAIGGEDGREQPTTEKLPVLTEEDKTWLSNLGKDL